MGHKRNDPKSTSKPDPQKRRKRIQKASPWGTSWHPVSLLKPPQGFPEGSWDPSRRGLPKKVDFSSFSGTPGTSKIELSLKRELNFHFFTLLRFWTQNGSKNAAKMEPKWFLGLPRAPHSRSWQLYQTRPKKLCLRVPQNMPKLPPKGCVRNDDFEQFCDSKCLSGRLRAPGADF